MLTTFVIHVHNMRVGKYFISCSAMNNYYQYFTLIFIFSLLELYTGTQIYRIIDIASSNKKDNTAVIKTSWIKAK